MYELLKTEKDIICGDPTCLQDISLNDLLESTSSELNWRNYRPTVGTFFENNAPDFRNSPKTMIAYSSNEGTNLGAGRTLVEYTGGFQKNELLLPKMA